MTAILRDSQLLTGRAFGETYLRENQTQDYVSIPPAAIITASDGSTFTLGTEFAGDGMRMAFNVLRNDIDTGIFASFIEYRRGRVRALTCDGWKIWSGKSFL